MSSSSDTEELINSEDNGKELTIADYLANYNEDCAMGDVYEKIKSQYLKNISERLNNVCLNSRIMVNIYYYLMKQKIINRTTQFNFETAKKLLFPLNIKKSNLSSNIDDLLSYISIKNPDVFAQIVYAVLPNSNFCTEDDTIYFSLCTVPSIFKYYATKNSQKYFAKFVTSLFDVHMEVNGYIFNKSHIFMKYIIMSFFNQFGCYDFVNSVFDSVFPMYATDLLGTISKYVLNGKGLTRVNYDFHIEALASKFVSRLWYSIPMIARPIRNLIAELVSIDHDNVIALFFIFDALVADQLSSDLELCNENDNQDDTSGQYNDLTRRVKRDLSVYLKEQYDKRNTGNNRRVIVDFIQKIADDAILGEDETYNEGILHVSSTSYFSSRDVVLLYSMIKEFCSYMDTEAPEPLTLFLSLCERHFDKQEKRIPLNDSENSLSSNSDVFLSLSQNSPFQTAFKFQLNCQEEEEYFIKVVEYQKHECVTQWSNSIYEIKNKDTLNSAIASLNINAVTFPPNKCAADKLISLLSHQVPNLRFHMFQGEINFDKVAEMAKSNREKIEEISHVFTSTQNCIDNIHSVIEKKVQSMRVYILRLSLVNDIDGILLNGNYIKFPLSISDISEAVHQYCKDKELEEWDHILQRITLTEAVHLFARHFYVCGQPFSEDSYEDKSNKWESRMKTLGNTQLSKTMQVRRDKCAQILRILNFSGFDTKLFYSIIIKAMKEINTDNYNIIASALVGTRISFLKDYQKFLMAFIYNKEDIVSIIGTEENKYIANFINSVNNFLL